MREVGVACLASHVCFAPLEREVAIMIVKELLGHSTITVTMRYTISNLDSKVAVVGKIVGSTVHQLSAVHPRCHNSPLTCRIR